jgi:hypothetical protein
MINPEGIPIRDSGQLHELHKTASNLTSGAKDFSSSGRSFHERFQRLEHVYRAPEDQDLLNSTKKIEHYSNMFGFRTIHVARALVEYANTAIPANNALIRTKEQAEGFVNCTVKGLGDEWKRNPELVRQNNEMVGAVEGSLRTILEAEIVAHDRIQHLINGNKIGSADNLPKSGGDEAPAWGTREAPPSNVDRLWWAYSSFIRKYAYNFPFTGQATPDWMRALVSPWLRSQGPVFTGVLGLFTGPFTTTWHHGEDLFTGKFGSRLEKDGEALIGVAQLATGLALNGTPLAGALKSGLKADDSAPDWVRDWINDSDKAAAAFIGLDKFEKGDIAGGVGTIANVAITAIIARKLPAGFGITKMFPKSGRLGTIAEHVVDPALIAANGTARGLGRLSDAIPSRFPKTVEHALVASAAERSAANGLEGATESAHVARASERAALNVVDEAARAAAGDARRSEDAALTDAADAGAVARAAETSADRAVDTAEAAGRAAQDARASEAFAEADASAAARVARNTRTFERAAVEAAERAENAAVRAAEATDPRNPALQSIQRRFDRDGATPPPALRGDPEVASAAERAERSSDSRQQAEAAAEAASRRTSAATETRQRAETAAEGATRDARTATERRQQADAAAERAAREAKVAAERRQDVERDAVGNAPQVAKSATEERHQAERTVEEARREARSASETRGARRARNDAISKLLQDLLGPANDESKKTIAANGGDRRLREVLRALAEGADLSKSDVHFLRQLGVSESELDSLKKALDSLENE